MEDSIPPPSIPPIPSPPPPPLSESPLIPSLHTINPISNHIVPDEDTKLTETQKMLQQLFQDPLLSDLTKYISNSNTNTSSMTGEGSLITPNSITLEQVDTLIALEMGTAFEITILRCGLEPLDKKRSR